MSKSESSVLKDWLRKPTIEEADIIKKMGLIYFITGGL